MAVSVSSLNCHGFDKCSLYIKDSMCEKEPHFKLVQETWHLPNNSSVLSNVDKNYMFKETSGVNAHDTIISGRPFGGLATYFMKSFADKVERVNCKNKRICAIKYCNAKSFPMLILNVYMPCDDQSRTPNPEFVNTLYDIESLITGHTGDVLAGGDWNTDFSRLNSAQTMCLKEFILRTGLKLCWDHPLADKQPTYISEINGASSCIDHFLMSSNLFNGMTECRVDDGPLNPSDHHEVEMSFNYQPITVKSVEPNHNKSNKIAWHKVDHNDIVDYKDVMDNIIDDLELNEELVECDNVNCTNVSHHAAINSLCADIIDICLESGDACFPKSYPQLGRIPKWRDDVKPLRDESLFWHNIWKDAGRPPTGVLAMIMRRTRAKYHKAVSFCKSNIHLNRNLRLAESIENNLARDLWAELKKMDENRNTLPSSINGLADDSEIASIFGNKYKTLYNSVPTSQEELNKIRNDIQDELSDNNYDEVNVTISDVGKALSKLNTKKRDGTKGTYSDHFINCSEKMKLLITKMINTMLIHGYTPNDLLEAVVVSIPKDLRGNLCADDNYRGIALCSALCKIIDLIFMDKYSDLIVTSDLQFAYKEDHSSNMCTTVLKEVCSYYVSNNSDVYICLLDASKAFDRVHYGRMFNLLKIRKIPVLVRRLLLDMYTRQKIQATWNSQVSESFSVQNGVKQGGILSPIIFCIYIDELLIRIRDSGLGCHVGHLSYAGLGYADDVTTLAPNLDAFQSILHICEEFGEEFNVLWNCGKTKCMKIGGVMTPPQRSITLNGTVLKWKTKVLHLGNYIRHDLSDHDDIMSKKGVFISQVNKLNVNFGAVSSMQRGFLFQNYCCSWYGCQNWDLHGADIERMQIEWNKAVRRVLVIPYQTHTNLLPLLIKSNTFVAQFRRRITKFVKTFVNSDNDYVSFIGECARYNSHGVLGRNVTRVLFNDSCSITNPSIDTITTAKAIQELLDVRDKIKEMPELSYNDVDDMIDNLCSM